MRSLKLANVASSGTSFAKTRLQGMHSYCRYRVNEGRGSSTWFEAQRLFDYKNYPFAFQLFLSAQLRRSGLPRYA